MTPIIYGTSLRVCANNCVPNWSAGQELCLKLDKNCVSRHRKSKCEHDVSDKNYVQYHDLVWDTIPVI